MKLDTIQRFVVQIKKTPEVYLWLASSGAIITGRPITPTEYYRTIFNNVDYESGPENDEVVALKDVNIRHGLTGNIFDVALVDLNKIVAWGMYDPKKSHTGPAENF